MRKILFAAALVAVVSSALFADSVTNAVSDDVIRALVRSGDVCRAIGHHIWQSTPHVTLEYRPDGNYPEHRKCVLCGKEETKEPGAWK